MKEKGLEYWKEEYLKWEKSGKRQKEYCQDAGYSYYAFKLKAMEMRKQGMLGSNRWSKSQEKIKEKSKKENEKKKIEAGFIPMEIMGKQEKEEAYCRMIFGDGGQVIIEREAGFAKLRELFGQR